VNYSALYNINQDLHNIYTVFKKLCDDNNLDYDTTEFIYNFHSVAIQNSLCPILGINLAVSEKSILKGLEYLFINETLETIMNKVNLPKIRKKFRKSLRQNTRKANTKSKLDLNRRQLSFILLEEFLACIGKLTLRELEVFGAAVVNHKYRLKKFHEGRFNLCI
jgi:hypothetical protein